MNIRKKITLTRVFFLFCWTLSLSLVVTRYDSSCGMHEQNVSRFSSPSTTLAVQATNSWLSAPKNEIVEWYLKGRLECTHYLENHVLQQLKKEAENTTEEEETAFCGGYKSLLQESGMLIWPFGPYQTCPTYAKCWFGLLSCGNFNRSYVENIVTPDFKKQAELFAFNKGSITPTIKLNQWTIKSIYLQTRFVGQEIIVPELRYLNLEDHSDDVLIGQYTTTILEVRDQDTNMYPSSQLEIRHIDWYPSLLHSFEPSNLLTLYPEIINIGRRYIGEIKHSCDHKFICQAECDQYVQVVTTPLLVNVTDQSQQCQLDKKATALPLCFTPNTNSSMYGRWIRAPYYSSSTSSGALAAAAAFATMTKQEEKFREECDPTYKKLLKPKPIRYDAHSARLQKLRDIQPKVIDCNNYEALKLSASSTSLLQTYCVHKTSYDILDLPYLQASLPSSDSLFSIPPNELTEILNQYTTIHSKRPAALATVNKRYQQATPRWQLWYEASGNPCIFDYNDKEEYGSGHWFYAPYACKFHFYERTELYQCFRYLNIHHIHIHGDSMAGELGTAIARLLGIPMTNQTEYVKLRKQTSSINGVIITEEYSEIYDPSLSSSWRKGSLSPDVLITNQAFIHNFYDVDKYLNNEVDSSGALPRYRIYQNSKAPQGPTASRLDNNAIRQQNAKLQDYYAHSLGFHILDEYMLSLGRNERYTQGWEMYNSVRQMETMVVMNIICNQDWLQRHIKL